MVHERVTDEAVEAAATAMRPILFADGPAGALVRDERDRTRTQARAALEAAVPLLAPQPVVDREALVQLVAYCREREVYKGRDNEIGADTAYGDVADRLDAVLALINGTAK